MGGERHPGKWNEGLAEKDADEGEQAQQEAKLQHLTPENKQIVADLTD